MIRVWVLFYIVMNCSGVVTNGVRMGRLNEGHIALHMSLRWKFIDVSKLKWWILVS